MKIITKKVAMFLALLGALFLTGCNDEKEPTAKVESINEEPQNDSQPVVSDNEISNQQELVLDTNKCIGCGKCAKIATANFKMNGRKAEIISQENLENENVQKAIESCPVNAIKLN